MRLTMELQASMNDSYFYTIQAETKQQDYTILINKVLLKMGFAGAVILQKRIVEKCFRFVFWYHNYCASTFSFS